MTPSDFIKQLQVAHPFRRGPITETIRTLAAQYNAEDALSGVSELGLEGLAERLTETLRPSFWPSLTAALDQGLIAIGTVDIDEPNARMGLLGEGFAIVFHTDWQNSCLRLRGR